MMRNINIADPMYPEIWYGMPEQRASKVLAQKSSSNGLLGLLDRMSEHYFLPSSDMPKSVRLDRLA